MKILMLSWEYPPNNNSGLSSHVYYLSKSLGELGHEVHVITCGKNGANEKAAEGVIVHRLTSYSFDDADFISSVMHWNFSMIEEAVKLINSLGKFNIIHSHDWPAVYAAKMLKGAYSIPLVCTIHTTEHGRNNGIRTNMQRYIASAEWTLTYEAWKVIICSDSMKDEINATYNIPLYKLFVIANRSNAVENDRNEYEEVSEKHAWDNIALATLKLYEEIEKETKGTEWEVVQAKVKKRAVRKKKAEENIEEKTEGRVENQTKPKRIRKKVSEKA